MTALPLRDVGRFARARGFTSIDSSSPANPKTMQSVEYSDFSRLTSCSNSNPSSKRVRVLACVKVTAEPLRGMLVRKDD